MKTTNYNQYTDKYLHSACSIVSLLNILKYRYAVIVKPDFIMKLAIYFEKLWKRIPTYWADFNVITPAFISYLNFKTGLKFVLWLRKISTLDPLDVNTYMIWVKWYTSKKFNKIKADWIITKEEMDYLRTFNWGVSHAVSFDNSAGWYFIDTDWGSNTKLSLETLRYGVKLWLFGDNMRTIDTGNKETEEVVNLTVRMYQKEKINRLQWFIENTKSPYMVKAIKLYNLWK